MTDTLHPDAITEDLTAPPRTLWRQIEPAALGLGSIALLLIVWEALPHLVTLGAGTKMFFATPSRVAATLWGMMATGTLWAPLGVSAAGFTVGLVLSIVVGLPLGVLLGRSRTLNAMFDPFITAFNALPRIALAPLFILWFGLGLIAKIAVGVSLSIVILLSSTVAGARSVDPDLLVLARTLGATPVQVFFRITLPSAIPTIFSGLRLGLIYSLLGVISAEIIGSVNGLGVQLTQSAGMFDTNGVFGILVILALLGALLTWGMNALERRLLRWR